MGVIQGPDDGSKVRTVYIRGGELNPAKKIDLLSRKLNEFFGKFNGRQPTETETEARLAASFAPHEKAAIMDFINWILEGKIHPEELDPQRIDKEQIIKICKLFDSDIVESVDPMIQEIQKLIEGFLQSTSTGEIKTRNFFL